MAVDLMLVVVVVFPLEEVLEPAPAGEEDQELVAQDSGVVKVDREVRLDGAAEAHGVPKVV
ncbi:hypothetical protein DPMN_152034 [Dreissena polymorpha]|uniref:Uncharacterized protein n=1 Tax=Dreissena polymorpha TaxID=45954 RepID=A0A9D4FL29_DREPO|nr:hypothetical protein DPMN_152034 [Dreissena polymorpha]